MLILTRRKHEKLVINNHVVVTILKIKENQVKLGIKAPDNIPVNRGEIHGKIIDKKLNRMNWLVHIISNISNWSWHKFFLLIRLNKGKKKVPIRSSF